MPLLHLINSACRGDPTWTVCPCWWFWACGRFWGDRVSRVHLVYMCWSLVSQTYIHHSCLSLSFNVTYSFAVCARKLYLSDLYLILKVTVLLIVWKWDNLGSPTLVMKIFWNIDISDLDILFNISVSMNILLQVHVSPKLVSGLFSWPTFQGHTHCLNDK